MQVTIRCPVLLADALERIERHGALLGSVLLRDGARVAAILRMTLCDGLRVLSWMSERSISEYRISQSVPTLFVLRLKPPTDLPFPPRRILAILTRFRVRSRGSTCSLREQSEWLVPGTGNLG